MFFYFLFFFLPFLFLPQVFSDLPIHCLTKDLAGTWTFFLGPNNNDNTLSCSHEHPDKNTDHIFFNYKENFQLFSSIKLELKMPNIVLNEFNESIGSWTAIYDEGIEIRALDQTFFAFSKYVYNGVKPPSNEDDEQSKGYQSLCNETFLGWYYKEKTMKDWGCFYGEKILVGFIEELEDNKLDIFKGRKSQKIIEKQPNLLKEQINNNPEMSFYERFQQKMPLYDYPNEKYLIKGVSDEDIRLEDRDIFEPDYNFIEMVNNIKQNSPWTAKLHDHFLNKTHRHMKNLLGLTRFKELKLQSVLNNHQSEDNTLSDTIFGSLDINIIDTPIGFLQLNSKISKESSFNKEIDPTTQANNNDLPLSFDWRDYNSINYDTPVKHQGECGSCYAVAALSAMESRILIKTNQTSSPNLSLSGVLACSRYNQGCNGGYPELVAKHGMDHGFYEEVCDGDKNDFQNCNEDCYKGKLWKIKKYGYVGKGYYGSTSEESMMKELIEGGPIVLAINAAPDLYYYSKGVFISNPINALKQENGHPEVKAWQFTNHAVVCVGWGETLHEDNILKYWILKNSWGNEWGEKGYFKMLRGVNLGAVENQAIYIEPEL